VHVTVKSVVAVSTPVLKEPDVPVPPPPDDLHEVLLVDDQLMVALAPFAMEVEAVVTAPLAMEVEVTERDMTGRALTIVTEPSPPPQEARPETTSNPIKKALSRAFEPTASLLDMFISFTSGNLI
jgi:hypothetical protein